MSESNQSNVPDIQWTVVFDAPIQKVWEAAATSEGIAAWFMPNDFQPKIGHEFHLQSPYGPSPCKVLELDALNRLMFSWDESGWIVIFELKKLNGKTQFTLTHSGWKDADEMIPRAQENSSVIRDRMNMGWHNLINNSLRHVVEH